MYALPNRHSAKLKTRVLHFDVFTSHPGKGNPAGIVLMPNHLDGVGMQAVAATAGFPDAAFVLPSKVADFGIRYFSPRREVDLCGHATIAAAMALRDAGFVEKFGECEFSLETKAGILPIKIQTAGNQDVVIMSHTPSQFQTFAGDRRVHMHARHFSAPSSGTIEDPVTGTASGVLGAYYQEFIAKRNDTLEPIVVEQGYEVHREGRVLVWAEKLGDRYSVRIGGSAVFAGELTC